MSARYYLPIRHDVIAKYHTMEFSCPADVNVIKKAAENL